MNRRSNTTALATLGTLVLALSAPGCGGGDSDSNEPLVDTGEGGSSAAGGSVNATGGKGGGATGGHSGAAGGGIVGGMGGTANAGHSGTGGSTAGAAGNGGGAGGTAGGAGGTTGGAGGAHAGAGGTIGGAGGTTGGSAGVGGTTGGAGGTAGGAGGTTGGAGGTTGGAAGSTGGSAGSSAGGATGGSAGAAGTAGAGGMAGAGGTTGGSAGTSGAGGAAGTTSAGGSGGAGAGGAAGNGGVAGSATGGTAGAAGIGGGAGAGGSSCGNDIKDGNDVCDGTDLAGETCDLALGKPATGAPTCKTDCSGFDTSACVAITPLAGPSRGSAVALSPDDKTVVICNRDVGTVTVIGVDYTTDPPTLSKRAEVDVGIGSEPWQAVVSPDGNTAYVVLRHDRKLIQIDALATKPLAGTSVATGSEPTGVALTPTGRGAWVANWVDGTLMGIDTTTMKVKTTIDLNAELIKTDLLGVGLTPRPAMAHPRSVAITNNGDAVDTDESIIVTEYYAQRITTEGVKGANADTAKQGLLYRVSLLDDSVSHIALAPIADIGFQDQNLGTAGCFPNQLQSVTINGNFAFVSSICSSPKGPIGPFGGVNKVCSMDSDCPGAVAGSCSATTGRCTTTCTADADCGANKGTCNVATNICNANTASVKTVTSPVVHTVDLTTNKQVEADNLNAQWFARYAAANPVVPDDGSRRLPLFGNDVAFVPGTQVGYLTANGSDAVFRIQYKNGAITQVGAAAGQDFIDLGPSAIAPATAAGKNPIGIEISNIDHGGKKFAYVANDVSRNLTVIDLNTQAISGGAAAPAVIGTTLVPTAGTLAAKQLNGKHLFNTGLGRWSLKGQGWGACQSCHGDGLTDNVSWYFARGPRQSTSLDGTFSKTDGNDQRILNWTAIFDEIADFENNTRGVSGGVGAIVSVNNAPPLVADRIDINGLGHSGLNGSSTQAADPTNPAGLPQASVLTAWADIKSYVKTIRSPRAPSTLDPVVVQTGHDLFIGANCQGCHSGSKWTISKVFYTPSAAQNTALLSKAWSQPTNFPISLLPAATPANRDMRFGGTALAQFANFDQIQCILRPVGTFGIADLLVAAPTDSFEFRADMTTKAQGSETDGNGYNPPSLLGAVTGAPYFHAGNATTLEAAFTDMFNGHHRSAVAANFLLDDTDGSKRAALIVYLLSIDGTAPTIGTPAAGSGGGNFCTAQ